jgi:hypothetical protein
VKNFELFVVVLMAFVAISVPLAVAGEQTRADKVLERVTDDFVASLKTLQGSIEKTRAQITKDITDITRTAEQAKILANVYRQLGELQRQNNRNYVGSQLDHLGVLAAMGFDIDQSLGNIRETASLFNIDLKSFGLDQDEIDRLQKLANEQKTAVPESVRKKFTDVRYFRTRKFLDEWSKSEPQTKTTTK